VNKEAESFCIHQTKVCRILLYSSNEGLQNPFVLSKEGLQNRFVFIKRRSAESFCIHQTKVCRILLYSSNEGLAVGNQCKFHN